MIVRWRGQGQGQAAVRRAAARAVASAKRLLWHFHAAHAPSRSLLDKHVPAVSLVDVGSKQSSMTSPALPPSELLLPSGLITKRPVVDFLGQPTRAEALTAATGDGMRFTAAFGWTMQAQKQNPPVTRDGMSFSRPTTLFTSTQQCYQPCIQRVMYSPADPGFRTATMTSSFPYSLYMRSRFFSATATGAGQRTLHTHAARSTAASASGASDAAAAAAADGVTTPRKRRRWFRKGLVALGALTGLMYAGLYYVEPRMSSAHPKWRKRRVVLEGMGRFVRSVYVGLAMTVDYKRNLWGVEEDSEEYSHVMKECHLRCANRLKNLALKNGGLYIKMGQGFASMNHILPEEYVTTLAVLQDQAFGRPLEEVNQIFLEDFGQGIEELFREFAPVPRAAASLAQVHPAVTKDGKEVAVKVQYIDMRDRFAGDLDTMELLMDGATILFPKFDFGWIMKDARVELERELDFEVEAHNGQKCQSDLDGLGFVHVPLIDWDLTSKRVLTTEWINGCKVTDTEAIKRMGFTVADVAEKVFNTFATQIFCTGHVHADPHPGNMLIRPNPGNPSQAQVVLLDHGLYVTLSDPVRLAFCNLWKNIVLHNDAKVAKYAARLGVREYDMLASILFQRPFSTGGVGFKAELTQRDLELMQQYSTDHMDRIVEILKRMPRVLVLLMRNINLTRSINKEMGFPVNRFILMGRKAVEGLHIYAPDEQGLPIDLPVIPVAPSRRLVSRLSSWLTRPSSKGSVTAVLEGEGLYKDSDRTMVPRHRRTSYGPIGRVWLWVASRVDMLFFEFALQYHGWWPSVARWVLSLQQRVGLAPQDDTLHKLLDEARA